MLFRSRNFYFFLPAQKSCVTVHRETFDALRICKYNAKGAYHYDINVLPEIKVSEYASMEKQVVAKRSTDDMHSVIAEKAKSLGQNLCDFFMRKILVLFTLCSKLRNCQFRNLPI